VFIKVIRFLILRVRVYRPDREAQIGLFNYPSPEGEKIFRVLREFRKQLPVSEAIMIKKIEAERDRLLNQHAPLVDGSLGNGGLYDREVTISAACKVSKSSNQCLLLYKLVRIFQPQTVIELGTNVGISSAFQAAALSVNGKEGRLITLEASPYRLKLAKELHQAVGLKNVSYVKGLFSETLSSVLNEIGSVDCAFIDGHHKYLPTMEYLNAIWKHAKPSTLFIFDDIRWSEGMERAWSEIQKDHRFEIAVDLNSMGICIASQDLDRMPYATRPIVSPLESIW
jgi:predicted O-methyltransferase YrrM